MSDKDSWKEVFSDGVYKLKIDGSILRYEFLSSDATEYPQAADNGISTVRERARMMGKELEKESDYRYEEGVMNRKVHENKSECERSGGVYVSSYRKADGTHVHSYCRGHGDDFKGMYEEDHRYSRRRK